MLQQAGDILFHAISRVELIEGRERRKETPAQAIFIKVLQGLFDWAVENDPLKQNPAKEMKFLSQKSDGFHTWTEDELARFGETWPVGARERLAFDVLL